jgi:hypothetical protein
VYLATGFQIGLTDVPAGAQGVHTIVALRTDGTIVPGWSFTLPAGTSPTLTWTTECIDKVFGQPPTVGADGTVYVVSSKGIWGTGGDLVFALTRDGHLKVGWPYATELGRGGFALSTGGSPGATPPAVGPDGTVYLLRRVGSISTGHDEMVALAPDGTVRPGWPLALPDHAAPSVAACPASAGFCLGCWLRLASNGHLVVALLTDQPDVTSPLCLTTLGTRVASSPTASISTPSLWPRVLLQRTTRLRTGRSALLGGWDAHRAGGRPAFARSYGLLTTEPGETRMSVVAPPASEPVKPPMVASIEPSAAVDEAAIPTPVTMIGSMFTVSESRIRTVSTLPLTVADAPSDPGDFAVDGVPRKDTVESEPALSESVTWNDPGPLTIAATPASLKDTASVSPDDPPRWIVPTPVTVTLTNAGGAAVGCGVGLLLQAASASAAIIDSRFTTSLYASSAGARAPWPGIRSVG